MAHYCSKCGKQTMLMTGDATLEADAEPYESGKEELPKTGIDVIVDKHIIVQYCEYCDEIVSLQNE